MAFSLQRTLFTYALCSFALPLFSMEITEVSTGQTIIGKLYIDHSNRSAQYACQDYHTNLTEMGVPSCIHNPLISVIIMGEEKGGKRVDWTANVPSQIVKSVLQQYTVQGMDIDFEEVGSIAFQKKLPRYLPALCLCKAKTGTVVSFTIHNRPVQLLCSDNPITGQSFKKDYDSCMSAFITNPTYFYHEFVSPIGELVEHELIKEIPGFVYVGQRERDGLCHGKKGFVSMQKFILNLLEKRINRSSFLLLLPFCKN